jgi:transcriptional regulator with XRE-family HTH domain
MSIFNGEEAMTRRSDDLRALRLQKRLTQQEVADKLKVSQSYYSSIEAGRRPGEIAAAEQVVNRMRLRSDRTEGGGQKAGRRK